MKHIVLVAGSLVALSGAAVLASGCGSSEASQRASAAASSTTQREAASKPAPEKCPNRSSRTHRLSIVNKTESVLYPSAEGWQCTDWSEWGNPSALNGWAIGAGGEKTLRLEGALSVGALSGPEFTINFRFGTNVRLSVTRHFWMQDDQGAFKCAITRLLPGRFGPDTMRVTLDCSNHLTLEQVPPKQG